VSRPALTGPTKTVFHFYLSGFAFCIRHKMLDVKTGDLGEFLVEFLQVKRENSSISKRRLDQFFELAISVGMGVQ
jgi:hypothetical protein